MEVADPVGPKLAPGGSRPDGDCKCDPQTSTLHLTCEMRVSLTSSTIAVPASSRIAKTTLPSWQVGVGRMPQLLMNKSIFI